MPQEKKPINQNLTVPNALSVLRIIVIPFFAWFFMHDQLAIAVALLVLSGLSDCGRLYRPQAQPGDGAGQDAGPPGGQAHPRRGGPVPGH